MNELHDDEFMIVRIRDGAKIIPRLFLTKHGFSPSPFGAEKENREIASAIIGWLEAERDKRVSFGRLLRIPGLLLRIAFKIRNYAKKMVAK